MISDIIIALRQLRRTPMQTAIAILTLALGIGLSTTMGSLLKALVLDPFTYPDSGRIVQIWCRAGWPLTGPDFLDLREQSTCFEQLGAYESSLYNIGGSAQAVVRGAPCTPEVMPALGVVPGIGRWITQEDCVSGAQPVVVISHGLWQRAFGGAADIVGRHTLVNGKDTVIVGVMPADFVFSVNRFHSAMSGINSCSIWLPLRQEWESRNDYRLSGIARLKDGVSIAAANAEISTIGKRLERAYPDSNREKTFTARSLREELTEGIGGYFGEFGGTGRMNWLLFGAAMLVLLVACANVSSLLIARGTARQHEFTVRLALGANRWRVVRLLLVESAMLAITGAFAGIMLALWGTAVLVNLAPMPGGHEAAVTVDGSMLLFAVAMAFTCTVLIGLATAFAARNMNAADVIRAGGRGMTGTGDRQRLLRSLIVGQVAVTLLLANTAALFSTSYRNVTSSNSLIATTRVISGMLMLRGERYSPAEKCTGFVEQLVERVKVLPGVMDTAVTSRLPLEKGHSRDMYTGEPGRIRQLASGIGEFTQVTAGYFSTAGIGLLKGRLFRPEDSDANATAVIVNRASAEQSWPGEDPIGQNVYLTKDALPGTGMTVVGVVEDIRQRVDDQAGPALYMPYERRPTSNIYLVVRSEQDASVLAGMLRREIAALDPELPLGDLRTMQSILDGATQHRRFIATIMMMFMVCTIGLTMVGIYGTLSYYVAERTREIGVRVALGATRINIVSLILRRVGLWLIAGLLLGLGAIFSVAKVLQALLYEMQPLYPPVLIVSATFVLAAGLLAGLTPAFRATKIEPLEALRTE